ncbi:hypothetical protein C4J84_2359 [Pseudomonas sp. R11-23-07]|nr:hypothetical protein C4J84_2359 [Pseudomonas sp. R11-23-07]
MRSDTRVQVLACSATMVAQLGVTLYLPATPDIVESLYMSESQGYTSMLMYLGGAVVPLVFAARIVAAFGRAIVLLGFCCTLFGGSLLCIWASDSTDFYISRLLQGVGGGGAALIARALLSEIYSGIALAKSLSLLSYAFVFSLIAGQVAGGYLVSVFHWKILSLIVIVGSIVIMCLLLPVRERLSLLDARGRRRVCASSYAHIIVQRSFYLPVIVGGCSYGLFVIYQGMGVYVFDLMLGWSSSEYGLFGVGLGIAYFFGALSVRLALRWMGTYSVTLLGVSVMALAVLLFLLAILEYVGRHVVVMSYFAIWYAQAVMYPCVASMAVKKSAGIESMMLFSFSQQFVALLFGALATVAIPFGMHGVAWLAIGLGSCGAVVAIRLSIKRS